MPERVRILFLCTGNSCRSQMAEGWTRHLKAGVIEAYSAGTEVHGLNRVAVRVMAEAGVDISAYRSKHLHELRNVQFDYVVTVCGRANERCPVFPRDTRVVHVGFDDPPALARDAHTEEEALQHYRRIRDEIRAFVEALPERVVQLGLKTEKERTVNIPSNDTDAEAIREKVREGYGAIAREAGSCCAPAKQPCCGAPNPDALASEIGYDATDLAALPEGANLGLSCGNPTAIASLAPGEVVLDLGSGAGLDVFIAGRKVGPTGRVIGVDMTPDMLSKARRNLQAYRQRTGLDNVEFRLGEIESLPLADASVDVIISNCVINLSPNKPQVWREMFRVLKPVGRVAVSDIALLKPLPEAILKMVEALIGCVAGAVLVEDTERMAREAGFVEIALTRKTEFIDAMTDWNDPMYHEIVKHLPPGTKAGDFATSLYVTATKPAVRCGCQ